MNAGTSDKAREIAMKLRRGDPLPSHLRVWAHRQLGQKLEEMVGRGDVVGLCKVFGANPRDYIGRPNQLKAMCRRAGLSGELPAEMFNTPEARAEARETAGVKPEGRLSLWSKLQSEKARNEGHKERWDLDHAGERTATLDDGTVIDVVTGEVKS